MATTAPPFSGPSPGERTAGEMTLAEHLAELRRRLIWSIIAVAAGAALVFGLYDHVLAVLIEPYQQVTGKQEFVILSPLDGLSARLKVAGYGGLLLASPVVLWQVWRFVTPGLHPHEKRWAIPFILSSILLFAGGTVLAFLSFPRALEFLVAVSGDRVETLFSPLEYITFFLRVVLGFGIAFEFPILLVFLQLARVVTPRRLLQSWRWAVVLIFGAAAVITPSQDPITLVAMAGPMTLLYFGAILAGRLLRR